MITKLLLHPPTFKILSDHPWALLDPEAFELTDHLHLVWGTKHTETYFKELDNINGLKNKAHFIAALGFPSLAYKTVLRIFYFILEGRANANDKIAKKAQVNFTEAFLIFQQAERELVNFKFAELPKSPKLSYCITGSLSMLRAELVDYLTKFRWEYVDHMTKAVDFLIIGEKPGNKKRVMAERFGIPILTTTGSSAGTIISFKANLVTISTQRA